MRKGKNSIKNNNIRIVKWMALYNVTQEEAEAYLHKEGYDTFCWYDVPGADYPEHKHLYDECLWVLKGQLQVKIGDDLYMINSGDKIYIPTRISHITLIPMSQSATYLVGQKHSSHHVPEKPL